MIPVYLLLENFMSHARSELDFSQFDIALIIGMDDEDQDVSNGTGKTTLFRAIEWVVYGKCGLRTKRRIIKRGKVSCTVTFIFQLNDDVYKIVRKASQRAASNEVSLLIKDGDNWRDLSCDTPTGTSDKIVNLLHIGHEIFVNSTHFRQNEILQFVSSTASQKKDILKESLHIEVWDKYQDKAKDVAKRLSIQISDLDDRIKALGDPDHDITMNKVSMDALKIKINKAQTSVEEFSSDLKVARTKIKEEDASVLLKRITARGEIIQTRKKALLNDLESYKTSIEKAKQSLTVVEEKLLESSRTILAVFAHPTRSKAETIFKQLAPSSKMPSLTVFPDKLAQDKELLAKNKQKASENSISIKQLLALEPGKKCPTCLTELEDLDKVIQQRKRRLRFLENAKQDAEAMSDELSKSIARQEKALVKANNMVLQLEYIEDSLNRWKAQESNLLELCSKCEEELRTLASEWQGLKEEKARILESFQGAESAQKEVKELEKKLEDLHQNILTLSVEYGNLQGHLEDLERRLSEKNSLSTKKPALTKELDIHNQLVKAFGKSGVPAIIMENVTDDLRNYANDILKRISDKPMSIDFITQKRTDSGSWSETFDISVAMDDEINEFEDLSGGEQVRIAIAMRLALNKVLTRRMGSAIKFLLLDEVDQALDRRSVQALADALRILSKEFKILVITHNEGMKERFEHIISVQKGHSGSFLRQ